MARGLDAATITALESGSFDFATLILIDFPTPIRITDWARDVSDGSNTFLSSASLQGLGDVTETSELRVNEFSLVLSGADQTYISTFLRQQYLNVNVKIWRAVMSGDTLVGDKITVFDGIITGCEISEDLPDSTVDIKIASHWKDFERVAGRKTTHTSQKRFYPLDDGFSMTANENREIVWGRKL